MGCEMDLLFSQVFSGSRTPYNPHHLLYVTWKYANSLAGYEQQVRIVTYATSPSFPFASQVTDAPKLRMHTNF